MTRTITALLGVSIALALLVGAVAVATPAPKLDGPLRDILVKGSPWEVSFERLDGGARGRFNQTFADTVDGAMVTRTDEVGPYETSVRIADDGKSATWTSPHGNLIKLSLRSGELYGEGRGGNLRLTYKTRNAVDAAPREHRVALVVGNAAYGDSPLNNPANDARGMAQALRAQSFDVIELVNADLRTMRRGVAQFGERLRDGGVGLFFYSGHGMQVNGRNYLIPIGAQIPSESYVGAETLDVDSVLGQMDAARSRVNVVILDACRNNPFARRFRSPQRGLAFMQAPLGTFIAYATSPGDVADDGTPGGYGVFTGELLKAMREPLKIEDVFKRVGLAVQERTQRRQTPWVASNLTGDFAFVAAPASVASVSTPRPKIEDDTRPSRPKIEDDTRPPRPKTDDDARPPRPKVQEDARPARPADTKPPKSDAGSQIAMVRPGGRFDDIPLPERFTVTPADPGLPPEIAAWSGLWAGHWHNGAAHVLGILKIGGQQKDGSYPVRVLYGYGRTSGAKVTPFSVEVDGTLKGTVLSVTLTAPTGSVMRPEYRLTRDGAAIEGYYRSSTGLAMQGTFAKQPQ